MQHAVLPKANEISDNANVIEKFNDPLDFTLIWLDRGLSNVTTDIQRTLTHLHQLTNNVLTFDDVDKWDSYMKNNDKTNLFLIVAGSLSENVLLKVDCIRHVDSVFIFCFNQATYEHLLLSSKFKKLVGVYNNTKDLIESVEKHAHLMIKQLAIFKFFDKKQHTLGRNTGSFFWFQVLLYVLRQMPKTAQSQEDMLEHCTNYYRDNSLELTRIEEFRRTYNADMAISWYTRDTFIYRMVNQALRTENIDALYLFRVIRLGHMA
ncbi:unnamed protein product [Didymodactylos carnosus]|uniref:Uncharacterized protein n=1 Tax=Didymodactylos carnosus TaxID=1234261 RepID=A0A814P3M8_9BILA|nr:unnamed protein product [Didymodactylos carnosus]CAF3867161.1 unnamed protein product [Didymodactylos carnosus]